MAKSRFADKFAIVDALKEIEYVGGVARKEGPASYYLMRKLVARGFVTTAPISKLYNKGKQPKAYVLSGKGKGYLALSKNWPRDVA